MRKNVNGLLSQFGFGINNDLLALLIVLAGFALALGFVALVSAL